MVDKKISRLYAGALLEVGIENNLLNQIEEEFRFLKDLLSEYSDLRIFLNSPFVSKESKKDFIERIFSGNICDDILAFLKVLINNERQSLIDEIYESFIELIERINNQQRVQVTSSIKLTRDAISRIGRVLKDKLNKEIIIDEVVDRSILGGIVIKIDDEVIDGSISKDLKRLRAKLLASSIGSVAAYED